MASPGGNRDGNIAFTASWPAGRDACGVALDLGRGGNGTVLATWAYTSGSGIHGMAAHETKTSPPELRLYSADLGADAIWTHRILGVGDGADAISVAQGGKLSMNEAGSGQQMHPRHLAVHPAGTVLYAVMEAGNSLVSFSLSGEGLPTLDAGGSKAWTLLPDSLFLTVPLQGALLLTISFATGANSALYWSADLSISPSSRYLWATARAQSGTARVQNYTGALSVFELDSAGTVVERLLTVPTSSRGGSTSNAIAVAPWSDEFAILTDVPGGYVEVWRLKSSERDARPVARVEIGRGCCANGIWSS